MKSFLRENTMIVVSIALPLLVVILFALASILPNLFSSPPAHDLLLTYQEWVVETESPVRVNLVVVNDRVKATVFKVKENDRGSVRRIFRYDHLAATVSEIHIPMPENIVELPDGAEIPIPELTDLKVSNLLRAPDGYEFRGHEGSGGLMRELFGVNRSRNDVNIANDGAIIRVRLPTSNYWYGDVRFLGWVID
ncbi:MAG: hypothetical protein OER85_08325 [Gammaproteobacteria bacterium]|nr:hypothetical protein [Gammaproteobacteria bacterium]